MYLTLTNMVNSHQQFFYYVYLTLTNMEVKQYRSIATHLLKNGSNRFWKRKENTHCIRNG